MVIHTASITVVWWFSTLPSPAGARSRVRRRWALCAYYTATSWSVAVEASLSDRRLVGNAILGSPRWITACSGASGRAVKVAWPAQRSDLVLEFSEEPAGSGWCAAKPSPAEKDGLSEIILPATRPRCFFRLRAPSQVDDQL